MTCDNHAQTFIGVLGHGFKLHSRGSYLELLIILVDNIDREDCH